MTKTKTFTAQAASFAAAALLTVGMFAANSALAAHEYRAASIAQVQTQQMVAVQHVTIVGHRTARA
jgi:hypothetical protein